MGWSDYHLNTPFFCTPLPVMRGLVSAVCERREAVDPAFHASCVLSGSSAVAESCLTDMLFCSGTTEIPFRRIEKEAPSFVPYDIGVSRYFSFMHMFDAFLRETLEGGGQRNYMDSTGDHAYDSLNSIASALSEPLIAPHSFDDGAEANADGDFQVVLNAAWASQRTRMLKLLRYVGVGSGGFTIRQATADSAGYGGSPQNAYDAIRSWTLSDTVFAGWETPLECRLEYHSNDWSVPAERWAVESAWEPVLITPFFDGCLSTSAGALRFDAVDLRERDEEGAIVEDEFNTYVFDPLCTTVSSGSNTLVLSSGSFASWEYGSASAVGGSGAAPGQYVRGWQARNVSVVYDYESTFNFKQEG
jgi:hypothetical protein